MNAPSAPLPSFGARILASEDTKQAAINPSNSAEEKLAEAAEARSRIPMSIPRAKLSTPELPGFHLHWINDTPGRILQAQQAGYRFVDKSEALITSGDLAGDPLGEGSDLGSRVSVVVGKQEDGATAMRAYLMKIPNEFFKEDQLALQTRVDQVHEAMEQGNQQVDGESPSDRRQRYVKSVSVKSTYSRRA